MLEVTTLGDTKRTFVPANDAMCAMCENNGKGADKCMMTMRGDCNFIPIKLMDPPKCKDCAYATETDKDPLRQFECSIGKFFMNCDSFVERNPKHDAVNAPNHYVGKIECIDYLRDKLTAEEFVGFCMGNVLKYSSRWRKKDGVQDLKKAEVYLKWAIEAAEKSVKEP